MKAQSITSSSVEPPTLIPTTWSSTLTERILSTLQPQIDAAPSLTPTIYDDTAPDPQKCPGYKASNVADNASGFTADLTMIGSSSCQAFGNDIRDLIVEVQYQTKERLNLKIYPKYVAPENHEALPVARACAPA